MKALLRRLVCVALVAVGAPAWADPAVISTEQVRAELVAHAPDGVGPGKPLWLGLKLEHQPHWHTYWKNPGDSGLPTTLAWQLPDGVSAGEIAWPAPKKLPIGPLVNYGYEDTLLLPVPVTLPAGFDAGSLAVKLHADWLVCKDVCIPQGGDFSLNLPARAATAGDARAFAAAAAAQPRAWSEGGASAELVGDALVVRLARLPEGWQGRAVEFFPEAPGVLDNAARPTTQWRGGAWEIRLPLSPQRFDSPARMAAVLASAGQAGSVQVAFDIRGNWPAAGSAVGNADPSTGSTPTTAPVAPAPSPIAPSAGLLVTLLLALAGGALLNLMPCVFPVLSLKVLGFAARAHDRRALLGGGLAYTAGVVLSFVALAGLLLALRAGGEQLGWGFQLQSPGFVIVLAALFTLIGLNLAGVFEVGSLLPNRLATLQARHPLAEAALTGVLAVAIASPCTTPFMGASLGVAATLPWVQAVAVFAALGLGMAAPYLAASAWPALARALPRPGMWMSRLRSVMAFPMFATVAWLVWVLGQQVGIDGAAALLGVLVALAFVAWALGAPGLGRAARLGFGGAAALLLVAAVAGSLPTWREPATAPVASIHGGWEPWSEARVAELAAEGRPVFVDFTAAWCVTCQFNKRSTLTDARVLADFEQGRVALLRADWTRRDAAITQALARLGRNGVPVYALYRPGSPTPQLLPELLSVQTMREVLGGL